MGGSVLGCFAYVNLAQQTKDKEKKMEYMFIHKSFGTLAAMLLVPRVAIKVRYSNAIQCKHMQHMICNYHFYYFTLPITVTSGKAHNA